MARKKETCLTTSQVQRARLDFGPNDIICGLGTGVNNNPGNIVLRYVCWQLKGPYRLADSRVKASIAKLIVDELACLDPPGRFVGFANQNQTTECYEVPMKQAIKKVSQALRENNVGCPWVIYRICPTLVASHTKLEQHIRTNPKDAQAFQDTIQKQILVGQGLIRSREFPRLVQSEQRLKSGVPNASLPTTNTHSLDNKKVKSGKSTRSGLESSPKDGILLPWMDSNESSYPATIPLRVMAEATNSVNESSLITCTMADEMRAVDSDHSPVGESESQVSSAPDEACSFQSRIFANCANAAVHFTHPGATSDAGPVHTKKTTSMAIIDPSRKPLVRQWQGSGVSFFLTWVDAPATKQIPVSKDYPYLSLP